MACWADAGRSSGAKHEDGHRDERFFQGARLWIRLRPRYGTARLSRQGSPLRAARFWFVTWIALILGATAAHAQLAPDPSGPHLALRLVAETMTPAAGRDRKSVA